MTDYTPDLHLPLVAPNQNQKEATINTALAILESAANDSVTISLISGNLTLNDDQYTKYFHHQFVDHASSRIVSLPATRRWFAVENLGGGPITFKVTGSTGLSAELPSGKIGLVVSDGVDVRFVVPDPTGGLGLLRDLSDVDGIPTDGQLLRWYAADSLWKPWTLTLPFKGLSDVPSTYVGEGGKLLAVRMDGTGIEFVSSAANINSFVDLDDTPNSYSGSANFTVKVNSAGTGLTFALPRLTEAADFPSNYTGAAGKLLRVNSTANGVMFDVLKVVDLSDGPGAPSAPNALRYIRVNAAGNGWEYATGTGGPDHFTQLEDTPDNYTGKAKQFPRVNDAEDGLIFSTVKFTDLADGPGAFTGSGKKFLRINTAANAIIYDAPKVEDLADGPGAPAVAHAKKVLRVNTAGNAVEYITLKITDLGGFPSSFTGQGGKYLIVKGDESGIQFTTASYTTSFLNLTDVPAESYAGLAGRAFVVDPTATGLIPGPIIPTRLGQLADVEDGTGTPQQGDFLRWIDGVWQADPFPVTGGGGGGATELAELTDVEIAASDPPQDGQVLGFSAATGKWTPTTVQTTVVSDLDDLADVTITSPVNGQIMVYRDGEWVNEDPASQGVPSNGSHIYWRLLLHATDGSTVQYGIQEIQFKQSKFGPDLANGGTASASTDEFGTASGAFDNVISGAWFSTTAADGQWIKYQFPTPAEVRYMTIQGSQSQPNTSPSAFSVQWSDNDADWTTAWEVTGQTGWAPGQTREFHAPIDLYFTDLADAPQSYIGQAAKLLRVKGDSSGLEFFTLFVPTTLGQLADVEDATGTPQDGYVLTYKDGVWQAEPPAGGSGGGGGASAFIDLTDAPSSYAGEGGNAVRVKMTEDGLEFYSPGTGGGGGGGWRGGWAAGAEQVFITFDDGMLNPAFSYDASGFSVVNQPDSVAGTTYALKFRPIGNGASCYCELPIEDVVNAANLKVRYKVSSEGPDYFRILQDGSQVLQDSGNTGLYEEFSLATTGDHTLRFTYSKDGSLAVGDDTVYISQITYYKTLTNPYVYGDTVTYQGAYWFCRQAGTSEAPGDGDDWIKLPESLANLKDIDFSTPPTSGQTLVYDSLTSKFKPGAASGGGSSTTYNIGLPPRTRVHRAAVQAIATATWTAVQWDTEAEDAVNAFVSGSNTRITVPAGVSKARATAYVNWGSNMNGATIIGAALRRNGVETGSTGGSRIVASRSGQYESHLNFTSEWFPVTAGDYYELFVLQQSGITANLNGPVTNFGENTYLQFEWDDGTPITAIEAGDTHGAHQGWRVILTDSQTGTFATISELKFYDRSGVQIPTTGGKLFDTNSSPSYPVQQAFDGNTTTYWSSSQVASSGVYGGPGYIFASPVDVGSIKITSTGTDFNTTNSPQSFVIQYTDDGGVSWLTYHTVSGQTGWGDHEERTFVLPLVGVARVAGARMLDELRDVTLGTPKNGDLLTYDSLSGVWKQKSPLGWAPPLAAHFPTAVGSVALTLADDADVGLTIDCGAAASGDVQRGVFKSLPTSGDWSVTAKIIDHLAPVYYNAVGLMLRESTTGKLVLLGCEVAGSSFSVPMRQVRYSRLPGLTGFTANDYGRPSPSLPQWYRLSYTAATTTLKAEVSSDGKFWRTIVSQPVTTGFTTKPDQVGLGCSLNYSDTQSAMFSVPYWAQSF
ncbi:tail protein [Caulobacter phage CcrColossus]|uniref:Putative tail protein n=1 Tax=Caulobacter phage CcrColossus TaxID=1211640 RepID=K4JUH9_9CAUD|nr:tail protein [Caulobacter phage CcrColossus]AFU87995.1 putative tail protein [Caulobacter phage CcrColossus]